MAWRRFNSQPPEGGWFALSLSTIPITVVSTHSRPKAAGHNRPAQAPHHPVSTHSRPKAAGFVNCCHSDFKGVSTHSRPKAAGAIASQMDSFPEVSTHSRPKAAGWGGFYPTACHVAFQLTAARRRLVGADSEGKTTVKVSTHSRPKAAGCLPFS